MCDISCERCVSIVSVVSAVCERCVSGVRVFYECCVSVVGVLYECCVNGVQTLNFFKTVQKCKKSLKTVKF